MCQGSTNSLTFRIPDAERYLGYVCDSVCSDKERLGIKLFVRESFTEQRKEERR